MTTLTPLLTADDLLHMPDDHHRYELVRGELRKMPPAGYQHGRITMILASRLDHHVRTHHLGVVCAAETGFQLTTNPDTVRAPDIAFLRRERVETVGEVEGYWPGAPDLVVEVISPGDRYTDVEEKILDWLDAGTQMVVVVDPRNRVVTVYRSRTDMTILTDQDTLDGGEVIPGWTMPVQEVFA